MIRGFELCGLGVGVGVELYGERHPTGANCHLRILAVRSLLQCVYKCVGVELYGVRLPSYSETDGGR